MALKLCPITLKEAIPWVMRHHRHHKKKPSKVRFAVAVSEGDEIVGVAIVGDPVARMLEDGYTAEVVRLCTLGHKNACSMLYQAAWRAARALGFRKLITYILDTEKGASLSAAGWKLIGQAGGGSWSRTGRPRVDMHPTQGKLKWEAS